jgi:hypothetical protein
VHPPADPQLEHPWRRPANDWASLNTKVAAANAMTLTPNLLRIKKSS